MNSIITYHTYNAGSSGLQFCLNNPLILQKILYFSICSAIGQSFIFFTIANFDPLVSWPSAAECESYSWSGRYLRGVLILWNATGRCFELLSRSRRN